MAVPAASEAGDWCYISSGTWSLMGAELSSPVINDACRRYNFTNEGGVGGTTRLLKNIAGMWLIQECRRIWNLRGRSYGWDELVELAAAAAPCRSLINPNHPAFVAPLDMPQAIVEYCRGTQQPLPETDGAIVRCALESLALCYRLVLGWLEQLVGRRLMTIHIVGGGVQNQLLCQMAADACNRLVVAGPVEATALGNLLMQAIACGDVDSIASARAIVGGSFDVQHYEPQKDCDWNEAFERFERLIRDDAN
jgi:rhamnulokinase